MQTNELNLNLIFSYLWRIMEPCDSGGHAGCREGSDWENPFGSEWLVLPADTSSTWTQVGDQEDGAVLCGGRVRQVPL